jgi:hypothetical protein
MVVDCSVIVTVQPTAKIATEEDKVQELLYPARHNITLPLNGLNILFNACETAFNHTTQIATDRCVFPPPPLPSSPDVTLIFLLSNFFLDFDGWSHLSAIEQNFNPSSADVTRKQKRGKPRCHPTSDPFAPPLDFSPLPPPPPRVRGEGGKP